MLIFADAWWKSCDEVHSDMLKRSGIQLHAYTIKGCFLSMREDFVLLTYCTSFDIFCNPLSGSRPMVLFRNSSGSFVSSGMSCCGNVMPNIHDFSVNVVVGWDYKLSFLISPNEPF